MEGVDGLRRKKSIQERLRLKGIGCCGSKWMFGASNMFVDDGESDHEELDDGLLMQVPESEISGPSQTISSDRPNPGCIRQEVVVTGMNLAAALAAEREFRASQELERGFHLNGASPPGHGETVPLTPLRVSLMRLLEESDDVDVKREDGPAEECDSACCVCMGRKKGAAFIPCGHTFCRVCSRELWVNRGACPLCNRSIQEILDIY